MYQLPISKETFRQYYEKTESCWEWKGYKQPPFGYGKVIVGGRSRYAHQISYMLYNGFYKFGFVVRHTCDNPGCVNPEHLVLGTMADNTKDMMERGRQYKGPRHSARKFHPNNGNQIMALLNEGFTKTDIAAFFQVTPNTITKIANGDHWLSEFIDNNL